MERGEKDAALPLRGVKVLDLTRVLAGPFCTLILADLGATVVKVEPLPEGDITRKWGPPVQGHGTYFLSINRNKRSLGLHFRHPRAKEVLGRLVRWADVLIENFRPGVMEEMGLDEGTLRALNPRLVYASINAYGSTGPYRDRPGFDQIAQGMSGLMSVTGFPESGPVRVGVAIGDMAAGLFCTIGLLSALLRRECGETPPRVEVCLVEALMGLLGFQAQRWLSAGEEPGLEGNDHPLIAPYGLFEAKDGYFNLAVGTEEQWQRLCRLLGLEGLLSDPRFKDNPSRVRNREVLKEAIKRALRGRTRQEWIDLLNREGVPCAPLYTVPEAFADPHIQERRVVQTVEHPVLGPLPQVRSPILLGGDSRSVRSAPPLLGQHTREVLAEAGLTREEIAGLYVAGVVGGGEARR